MSEGHSSRVAVLPLAGKQQPPKPLPCGFYADRTGLYHAVEYVKYLLAVLLAALLPQPSCDLRSLHRLVPGSITEYVAVLAKHLHGSPQLVVAFTCDDQIAIITYIAIEELAVCDRALGQYVVTIEVWIFVDAVDVQQHQHSLAQCSGFGCLHEADQHSGAVDATTVHDHNLAILGLGPLEQVSGTRLADLCQAGGALRKRRHLSAWYGQRAEWRGYGTSPVMEAGIVCPYAECVTEQSQTTVIFGHHLFSGHSVGQIDVGRTEIV